MLLLAALVTGMKSSWILILSLAAVRELKNWVIAEPEIRYKKLEPVQSLFFPVPPLSPLPLLKAQALAGR